MTKLRIAALAIGCALPLAALAADGSIEGTVDFTGKAPTPAKLHREADPFCAKKPMTDPSVLVKNGRSSRTPPSRRRSTRRIACTRRA